MTIRVLVVDDHPIVREGVQQVIEEEPDFTVCAHASSCAEALEAAMKHLPDIGIIDLSLGSDDGVELIEGIRRSKLLIRTIVLSAHDDWTFWDRAFRAGACGYIVKDEAPEMIIPAIRDVLAGRRFVCPSLADQVHIRYGDAALGSDGPCPTELLTPREWEVLERLARGLTSTKIAEDLGVRRRAINEHYVRMEQKLKLGSSTELAQFAVRWYERNRRVHENKDGQA